MAIFGGTISMISILGSVIGLISVVYSRWKISIEKENFVQGLLPTRSYHPV
ncbi:MAG: hypothetical protein K2X02_02830 [Alphaproteobacteria bacterium]|nr:hypothetical protein [Alphaproteobacteria bacterium]